MYLLDSGDASIGKKERKMDNGYSMARAQPECCAGSCKGHRTSDDEIKNTVTKGSIAKLEVATAISTQCDPLSWILCCRWFNHHLRSGKMRQQHIHQYPMRTLLQFPRR